MFRVSGKKLSKVNMSDEASLFIERDTGLYIERENRQHNISGWPVANQFGIGHVKNQVSLREKKSLA